MKTTIFSRYESSQFGSACVEPHHLLLALLRAGKPLFAVWSLDSHEAWMSIRAEVERTFPPKVDWGPSKPLPLSQASKRVLDYAIEEAEHMGMFHIGVEHLLLGIPREELAPGAVTPCCSPKDRFRLRGKTYRI
ncbi:MAG: Clp protease N-terminal domain-containing protein [Bryobacteraceae bacterium]